MKQIFIILVTFLLLSCAGTSKLNKQIYKSQIASIQYSPFETAKRMKTALKVQIKYRYQYDEELKSIIEKNKSDTIILSEKYDEICFGCPADNAQIFILNKHISYHKNVIEETYNRTEELLSYNLRNSTKHSYQDITKIFNEIQNGLQLSLLSERYGTVDCFGGVNTLYTVFYPSGKIESMYMRCWI